MGSELEKEASAGRDGRRQIHSLSLSADPAQDGAMEADLQLRHRCEAIRVIGVVALDQDFDFKEERQ